MTADPKPSARAVADRELWAEIAEEKYGVCRACGTGDMAGSRIELHHLVPRSLGGDDTPHNIVPLCDYCHRQWTDRGLGFERVSAAIRSTLTVEEFTYVVGRKGEEFLRRYYPVLGEGGSHDEGSQPSSFPGEESSSSSDPAAPALSEPGVDLGVRPLPPAPGSPDIPCPTCGQKPRRKVAKPEWTEGSRPGRQQWQVRIPKSERDWGADALDQLEAQLLALLRSSFDYDENTPRYYLLTSSLQAAVDALRLEDDSGQERAAGAGEQAGVDPGHAGRRDGDAGGGAGA